MADSFIHWFDMTLKRAIFSQQVRESHSLYIQIYIFFFGLSVSEIFFMYMILSNEF